jgi:phosphoglycerate dehydrogenase-like enzyme
MSSNVPPLRAAETPLEHATIVQLALALASRVAFHPLTLKAGLLLGALATYLYMRFNQKKSLKRKTIVLTGAGNGLGRAQAVELARQGCKVIIWDIDSEGLKKTVEVVKAKYPTACVPGFHLNTQH